MLTAAKDKKQIVPREKKLLLEKHSVHICQDLGPLVHILKELP